MHGSVEAYGETGIFHYLLLCALGEPHFLQGSGHAQVGRLRDFHLLRAAFPLVEPLVYAPAGDYDKQHAYDFAHGHGTLPAATPA